jgi:hypothetical protein
MLALGLIKKKPPKPRGVFGGFAMGALIDVNQSEQLEVLPLGSGQVLFRDSVKKSQARLFYPIFQF